MQLILGRFFQLTVHEMLSSLSLKPLFRLTLLSPWWIEFPHRMCPRSCCFVAVKERRFTNEFSPPHLCHLHAEQRHNRESCPHVAGRKLNTLLSISLHARTQHWFIPRAHKQSSTPMLWCTRPRKGSRCVLHILQPASGSYQHHEACNRKAFGWGWRHLFALDKESWTQLTFPDTIFVFQVLISLSTDSLTYISAAAAAAAPSPQLS